MINPTKPFFLFANCEIKYSGRARSTLEKGNYVIIRKFDGTLMIHGSTLLKPLNFQPPGATITDNGKIISIRNKESIEIIIFSIIHYYEINDWSNNKIILQDTESDLREQVIKNISLYFKNVKEIHQEFKTRFGPIDLLVIQTDDTNNVIELKRGRAGISACTQVERYLKTFQNKVCGFIMSPTITKGALEYAKTHDITYVAVNFLR